MSVQLVVDDITAHLRRLNRPIVSLLNSGSTPSHVSNVLIGLGLTAPDDLIGLYSCHDGTKVIKGDILDDLHFFPGFYWLSLADASSSYKTFRLDLRWDRAWFPIFGNGGGDFYAVVCDRKSPFFGGVVGFILEEVDHPIEFESISTMLQTISRCYTEGAYFLANGYLEANDMQATKVAKELNSRLEYYSE